MAHDHPKYEYSVPWAPRFAAFGVRIGRLQHGELSGGDLDTLGPMVSTSQ
jgi:hypothetical protein